MGSEAKLASSASSRRAVIVSYAPGWSKAARVAPASSAASSPWPATERLAVKLWPGSFGEDGPGLRRWV